MFLEASVAAFPATRPIGYAAEADTADAHASTIAEIIEGLSQTQKRLPTRLLYDARGSQLFEAICQTPEYYLTRAELAILREQAADIADFVGANVAVFEPGAGYGAKARLLLGALQTPQLYAPMDIDANALRRCAVVTRCVFPELRVVPLHADFLRPLQLPPVVRACRSLLFFPGSTIGNFEPVRALALLRRFRGVSSADGRLLIGVDLRKNAAVLRRAYDDADGITAAFNLNLLLHLNRDYGAHFDTRRFEHRAVYDKRRHRIEMHLVSRRVQLLRIGQSCFRIAKGETLLTECSYKYLPREFAALASAAGWRWRGLWLDAQQRFGVLGFEAQAL